MLDLSVVILTFDSQNFIQGCVDSLINSHEISFDSRKGKYQGEIVVVDNASRDGTSKIVLNNYSLVKLIQSHENLGFSKGNNLGIKKCSSRYILLLNPDAFVAKNTLEEMITFMDSTPKAGIATCFVELVASSKIDPASHRGFPTPWASLTYYLGLEKLFPRLPMFSQYHQSYKNFNKTHEVDAVSGSFMLVRSTALKEVGLLDEDYFMYAEDLDLCYRVKEVGWKTYFCPFVKAYHYKGMSSGIKGDLKTQVPVTQKEKEVAFNAFFDTMKMFYDKHYKNKYPKIIRGLVFVGIDLKKLLSKVKMKV